MTQRPTQHVTARKAKRDSQVWCSLALASVEFHKDLGED